ncbi:MAG: hypothetical protein ACOCUJ_03445, partial [Thiohalospira sp.]
DQGDITEGRAVLGRKISSAGTIAYSGFGYRRLSHPVVARADRVNHTIYIPVGFRFHNAFENGWEIRTLVEAGFIPWSEDQFDSGAVNGQQDTTVSRSAGYELRLSFAMENQMLSLEPFFRYFQMGSGDDESIQGTEADVSRLSESEFGIRVGLRFQ